MTYAEYKSIQSKYDKVLNELTSKLNSFPKNSSGLLTDESRKRPEYLQLKKTYDFTFEQYRRFNSLKESKTYSKQLSKEKRMKFS
jgi:hypothetical protein